MSEPQPVTWTLNDASTPAPIRVFYLTADDGTEAYYRVERLTDGQLFVVATFNESSSTMIRRLLARAHAARFLAGILDTIADFMSSGDELLLDSDRVSVFGNQVRLTGPGAVLASAAFFGDASHEIFNAYT